MFKRLLFSLMILVGCIVFTMNVNAERHSVTRTYIDCEGSMLVWEDKNLDGVHDLCHVFVMQVPRGLYYAGVVSPEVGERMRITAIQYCSKIKKKERGTFI